MKEFVLRLFCAFMAFVVIAIFSLPREAQAGGNQALVVQAQQARKFRGFIAPRLRANRATAQVQALNSVAAKNAAFARSNAVVVRSNVGHVNNLRALNSHVLQLQALAAPQQVYIRPQSVVVPQSVIVQQHVVPQMQILIQPQAVVPHCRSGGCR